MRPTLLLQPIHSSSSDILRSFAEDKPISLEQVNFLYWHQAQLSNANYDPILNYYLHSIKKKQIKFRNGFLLQHEILNFDAIEALKKRLSESLKTPEDHAVIQLTHKQLLQFKELTHHAISYYHSSQLISANLFYPRGVPPVLYFCWGKIFGVIKYVIPIDVDKIELNAIIYFENMENRNLDKCVEDYNFRLQNDIDSQKKIMTNQNLLSNSIEYNSQTPRLSLSDSFLIHHI